MPPDRRSVLSALGLTLPFGLAAAPGRAAAAGPPPAVRFRPFEDALRDALAAAGTGESCRVDVGYAERVLAGVQGCVNARPFAGFPAGRLRVMRVGAGPGPAVGEVRLYVCTVEVAVTDEPGHPLDFATLPAAPALVEGGPTRVTHDTPQPRPTRQSESGPPPACGSPVRSPRQ
jgi:hypothetical protein